MVKRVFGFLFKIVLWFLFLSVFVVVLYRWIPIYYTPLMAIRSIENNFKVETKHQWVPIEQIASSLQLAVICSEDQNFLTHNGFDLEAIEKAYKNNKAGKRLKGASTISQQTAKNVFLWPQRSWLRKGLELYFTFLIEAIWSKERILEVYLNSIEMGNGVYGAEAAATHWYGKTSKKLTQQEAARIAIILPNPRKYNPKKRTNYLEKRKQWVLLQMRNYGTFTLQN